MTSAARRALAYCGSHAGWSNRQQDAFDDRCAPCVNRLELIAAVLLAEGQEQEPMNLRIFCDEEADDAPARFYLRGCGGSGNGPTPEDAIRDLVMHRNMDATQEWPVRKLAAASQETGCLCGHTNQQHRGVCRECSCNCFTPNELPPSPA